jgi:hypothetical protein
MRGRSISNACAIVSALGALMVQGCNEKPVIPVDNSDKTAPAAISDLAAIDPKSRSGLPLVR